MAESRRGQIRDFGFIAALLGLAAVPLITCRGETHPFKGLTSQACWVAWLAVAILWGVVARRPVPADVPRATARGRVVTGGVAALLLLLTVVGFYWPCQKHFWGGGDDFSSLAANDLGYWSVAWDAAMARPLVSLSSRVAVALTPDRMDGFFWVAAFLCWANALLLFAIVRSFLPEALTVAGGAAVLLVVNRADPGRFLILWATSFYWTVLFFLLLGSWLFFESYRTQRRWPLTLACVCLAGSLLSSETAYPLAFLVPLAALRFGRTDRQWFVWSAAWYGTAGLCLFRVGLFALSTRNSYQFQQSEGALKHPTQFFWNFVHHLQPAATYFERGHWRGGPGRYALAALVIAGCLAGVVKLVRQQPLPWRTYVYALLAGGVVLVVALLPFLPFNYEFRTQFLAAPAQACLLALAVSLLASRLRGLAAAVVPGVATAILVGNATAVAYREQDAFEQPDCFARTTHVLRQVHALSPQFAPETLVLFVLDAKHDAIGYNYAVAYLTRQFLGAAGYQVNLDGDQDGVRVAADGVLIKVPAGEKKYRFADVVAFRLSPSGCVSLLAELPRQLLPPGAAPAAEAYAPFERLRPGPAAELPFFRYPTGIDPPRDFLDDGAAMPCGAGWGPLIPRRRDVVRLVADGAEVAVNPCGAARHDLVLELEPRPGFDGDGTVIEARAETGAVVARAPLPYRATVRLPLPVDPNRVCRFRLFLRPAERSAPRPAGAGRFFLIEQGEAAGYASRVPADVLYSGLKAGSGWYPVEHYRGETFRWLHGEAEVDLRSYTGATSQLGLVAQPGPGCGDGPCEFEALDDAGRALARQTLRGREWVRIPVPPEYAGRVRLRVANGGKVTPADDRVLNLRVFECGEAPR